MTQVFLFTSSFLERVGSLFFWLFMPWILISCHGILLAFATVPTKGKHWVSC